MNIQVNGDTATWRAFAVWREALQQKDYATALNLLKQYPSICFDGLPMRYAECVGKGFPKTFRAGLYEAGMLRPFEVEEFALLLKQQETGILTHAQFRLPLEAATPALNGSLEDLALFLDVTKGVYYDFAPVSVGQYGAIDALLTAKQPERLLQAVEQKLLACDTSLLVAIVEKGRVEIAQQLWATANADTQAKILTLALDEKDSKGEHLISVLACPPQEIWKEQAQVQTLERLCRQKDDAMRSRVAVLQKSGWLSEERVKTMRKACFEREAKTLLEQATAVTISMGTPHGEAETTLLADFSEFKDDFVKWKKARIDVLLEKRPLEEIIEVAQKGDDAIAVEMLKRNPSLKIKAEDVVQGFATGDDDDWIFVKALIQRCSNLNGEPGGITPLMAAVCYSDTTEIVSLLLSRKVNVNRNVSKRVFITWCLEQQRKELIAKGLEVEKWDSEDWKTLDAVETFYDRRFELCDKFDALDLAMEISVSPKFVRALLNAGALYDTHPPVNSPLARVICRNRVNTGFWSEQTANRAACAMALLATGAEANAFVRTSNQWNDSEEMRTIVLCVVQDMDSQELVRELVRKGAPVSLEAANAAIQKDWTELGQWLHRQVETDCATENDILARELVKYVDEVPWIRAFLRAIR